MQNKSKPKDTLDFLRNHQRTFSFRCQNKNKQNKTNAEFVLICLDIWTFSAKSAVSRLSGWISIFKQKQKMSNSNGESNKSEFRLKNAPDDGISAVRFGPNSSQFLLVSSWDKNVRLYDVVNNNLRVSTQSLHILHTFAHILHTFYMHWHNFTHILLALNDFYTLLHFVTHFSSLLHIFYAVLHNFCTLIHILSSFR